MSQLFWMSGCISDFKRVVFLFLCVQTPNEPKDKQVVSAACAQKQGCTIWASFASARGCGSTRAIAGDQAVVVLLVEMS